MKLSRLFARNPAKSPAKPSAGAEAAKPQAPAVPASSPMSDGGGYIDWAGTVLGNGATMVSGWASPGLGSQAWVEAGDQRVPLDDCFRYWRGDLVVSDHIALGRVRGATAAFLVSLPGISVGTPVRLVLQRDAHVAKAAELKATALPIDPMAAFKMLMSTHTGRFAERFAKVDRQVMQPLIEQQACWVASRPVETAVVGQLPAAPRVSIIIPLYKRFDFVEPQLMKFSRDAWLLANAELIYVVDDPDLADTMRQQAPELAALYGVPFRWVWGQVNRGFSGANNLGVSVARAAQFIFCNSDVFPVESGWAQQLVDVLDARPDLGAVAPRLLHADGTVQHAGMAFEYLPGLGIWSNQHPGKGLPDALWPERGLEVVPAVTGACLAMRRADLERIGGWDTGYLIGDFEDSDLCLSLRRLGLGSACLHSVRLVHLERQSFKLLGEDGLRTQVVILNAVRHQQRWAAELASLASGVQATAQAEGGR